MDLSKLLYFFSPFAKQNQGEVWPRFQSFLKLLFRAKGIKWVNLLCLLCLQQCFLWNLLDYIFAIILFLVLLFSSFEQVPALSVEVFLRSRGSSRRQSHPGIFLLPTITLPVGPFLTKKRRIFLQLQYIDMLDKDYSKLSLLASLIHFFLSMAGNYYHGFPIGPKK